MITGNSSFFQLLGAEAESAALDTKVPREARTMLAALLPSRLTSHFSRSSPSGTQRPK